MRMLHDSVCSGVVTANPNVLDVILRGEILCGLYEGGTVVGDDFADSAPSTEEVLPYPVAECLGSFALKHTPFGIVREGTMSLYDVFESS